MSPNNLNGLLRKRQTQWLKLLLLFFIFIFCQHLSLDQYTTEVIWAWSSLWNQQMIQRHMNLCEMWASFSYVSNISKCYFLFLSNCYPIKHQTDNNHLAAICFPASSESEFVHCVWVFLSPWHPAEPWSCIMKVEEAKEPLLKLFLSDFSWLILVIC